MCVPVPEDAAALGDWDLRTPAESTGARVQLRGFLAEGPLPAGAAAADVDRLLLTCEELASNGLRHRRAPVRVRITPTVDEWLIVATDAAVDRPPAPAVGRDPAYGGLGLPLVARLSARHGWAVRGGRKHVWARIRPA